jgi:hypothetical protein
MLPSIRKVIKTTIARFFIQGAKAAELIALIKEVEAERSEAMHLVSSDQTRRASDGEPGTIIEPPKRAKVQLPPARTTRGRDVIIAMQRNIRTGLLFMMKTSDGRAWGKVKYHELGGMTRDGEMARRIMDFVGTPMDREAPLNDLLTDAQFTEIYYAEAIAPTISPEKGRAVPVRSRRGGAHLGRAGRPAPAIHEGPHSRPERR